MYNYESPHPESLLHKKEYREEIKKHQSDSYEIKCNLNLPAYFTGEQFE